MNRRHIIWLTLLLVTGLLLPATPVLAGSGSPPGDDGVVVWNEDYTLEEGERLDGNLVVFNGDVTLEPDSRVAGAVIIWNGNAEVEGTVEGDVVVSGGDIYLGDDAYVEGNVVCSWDCDLEQEAGARVEGVFTEGDPLSNFRIGQVPGIPVRVPSPATFWISAPGRAFGWVLRFIRGAAAVLVVATVAGLVALIWPHPTAQIGHTLIEAPWHSLGIGALTVVAGIMLVVALAVTICLSPIAALAALALGAAGLLGWIAIGAVVGERLLQAFNARGVGPLWVAGLGTLVVTLVSAGLSNALGLTSLGWLGASVGLCLAPLGWLIILILGSLGLGAVVLTRFGTTAYTPTTGSGYRPPSPPPPPPTPTPVEEPELPESPKEWEEAEAVEGSET
jgi:hypothetical protein